jgi:hypothetical protein
MGANPKKLGHPEGWANPLKGPTVTGQHLRPLLAFVTVAIVGGLVFANAFRAQDVVDAIRGGASDVLAGTSLLHEPLYVVEQGEQIEAAPAPAPEVNPSDETDSAPVGPVIGGTPSTAAPAPVPTPAAGSDVGPGPTGQAGQGSGTGKAGGQAGGQGGSKGNGVPVAPKVGNHQGHGAPGGGEDSTGNGGGAAVGQAAEGHGNGHAGEDHGKGPGGNQVAEGHGHGHAGDKVHGASSGHGPKGHAQAHHGKSGHGESDHGHSDHAAPDHAKNTKAKNSQGQAKGHSHR